MAGDALEVVGLAEAGEVELCIAPSMLVELAEVLSYERLQPRLEQLGLTPEDWSLTSSTWLLSLRCQGEIPSW
jgi:predicted nucleic acid-binding protein